MANVLSTDKQVAIIGSLCEGSSIRSIERLTGIVEVFELHGHPTASRLYAWSHATDDLEKRRHVTVLHSNLITSPILAVRAAILQEFKSDATAEA
jgi:hypothetical protein